MATTPHAALGQPGGRIPRPRARVLLLDEMIGLLSRIFSRKEMN
jgi:hypothetical protein